MPEVPKIQKKLREAKFFLGHMSQSARSTRLDHEHLEFYLSAFLSAARSVTDFFEHKQQAWWKANRDSKSSEDLRLLNQMTKQRDNEVHEEGADLSHQVGDVPLSKIETPSGLHAAYAPSSGEPWGEVKVGMKVYYFMLGGKAVPVIETCQRYVGLLERAVEDFSKA
jgi:mRNA-degrading endonuclease YafQ of YafQ-DinJ toxin-antitoxin module